MTFEFVFIEVLLCILFTQSVTTASVEVKGPLDEFSGTVASIRKAITSFAEIQTNGYSNLDLLKQQRKLQDEIDSFIPFPCNTSSYRSIPPPESVHKLKPGDIDVIGAIGDSLTAGFGLSGTDWLTLFVEERGRSFSAGGEATWRTFLTLPNILKEFNPQLLGYANRSATVTDLASQLNAAFSGSMSADIPFMAKMLVRRIKSHPKISLNNHWKMISIMFGDNDFCSNFCYYPIDKILKDHEDDVVQVLRTLRDNLPRTIVNFIPPPSPQSLVNSTYPPMCDIIHDVMCPCLFGAYKIKERETLFNYVIQKWYQIDIDVSSRDEFDRDDFTVVFQPFMMNANIPRAEDGINVDRSVLAYDCFHFSQKGQAMMAKSLWANLLQPVGEKQDHLSELNDPLTCAQDQPYIFTRRNSQKNRTVSQSV